MKVSVYDSFDPFSVCFNLMKIKYKDYDESLTTKNFLTPSDKVNVFINLETCFKNLSTIKDLERKLVLQRDFDIIMTSNILNLAAHYKRFFKSNGLDTKVYIYNTDFDSEEFDQYKYNEDYRTYYLLKFNDNPKFARMTELLKGYILPEVSVYCEFIPDVYYISAKNIEGSLVPYIISQDDIYRKNLIISGEIYDTQYTLINNFVNHYIHKGIGTNFVLSSIDEYIKMLSKKESDELTKLVNVYKNYPLYCSLLSVLGDKSRSVESITGVGPKTLQKYIDDGIQKKEIQLNTTNPAMISTIFHDSSIEDEFVNNYYCTTISEMYKELTQSEISSVLNQRRDRLDMNSLINLNNSRFANYPLILESLLL
jgi:5'-3' exonuclease